MIRQYKIVLAGGALLGALAVMFGAFGSHMMGNYLEANDLYRTYDTATRYHFYHALALCMVGILLRRKQTMELLLTSVCFALGTILFSGSLYALILTDIKQLAWITPAGGLLLILGWLLLFSSVMHFNPLPRKQGPRK